MARAWFLAGVLVLAFVTTGALAQKPGNSGFAGGTERIHRFASDIVIEENGDLIITETIELTALGREIRRGPYRDFPTRYRDQYNDDVRIGFDVLEVLRDGRPEPWYTENLSNGVRLYIGQADVFLRAGRYTYTIRYRTTRQIHFDTGFDELYFNITGNGWGFPIDVAEATIRLPEGANVLETDGFTGAFGSTEQAFRASRGRPGEVHFATTRPLRPHEGLSIAVTWPKGFVAEPSGAARAGFLLADNASLLIALLGVIVVFAYYHWAWNRVGKDPAAGTIIPLFEPPEKFSPAAVRFVDRMGFDQKAFTAAIINMAVKGFLTIEEDDKSFRLIKASGDVSVLSPGEKKIADKLLGTRSSIKLKQAHHAKFAAAISGLKSSLKREYEATNFMRNTQYLIPGVGLSIITLLGMGGLAPAPETIFAIVWLVGWCIFGMSLLIASWQIISARKGVSKTIAGGVLSLVSITLMGIGTIFFWKNGPLPGWIMVFPAGAMAMLTPIYYHLLKAPTKKGRKVMDEIEGFRLFLSVAERRRLESFHPPEKTPELFEKYLPYALALDVENKWSEQFDDVLSAASMEGGEAYRPVWYHGGRWHSFGASGFAGAVSSAMVSSIASAATAPGSSSGIGGGGFSGGGGGGGGGGGW